MSSNSHHKGHPRVSFVSSLRRSFLKSMPASMMEEMRPFMAGSPKNRGIPGHHHSIGGGSGGGGKGLEISLRDRSDATAKRGFRVKVPQRLVFYTIFVFFVLPLLSSIYVLIRRLASVSSSKRSKELIPDLWSTSSDQDESLFSSLLSSSTTEIAATSTLNINATNNSSLSSSILLKDSSDTAYAPLNDADPSHTSPLLNAPNTKNLEGEEEGALIDKSDTTDSEGLTDVKVEDKEKGGSTLSPVTPSLTTTVEKSDGEETIIKNKYDDTGTSLATSKEKETDILITNSVTANSNDENLSEEKVSPHEKIETASISKTAVNPSPTLKSPGDRIFTGTEDEERSSKNDSQAEELDTSTASKQSNIKSTRIKKKSLREEGNIVREEEDDDDHEENDDVAASSSTTKTTDKSSTRSGKSIVSSVATSTTGSSIEEEEEEKNTKSIRHRRQLGVRLRV